MSVTEDTKYMNIPIKYQLLSNKFNLSMLQLFLSMSSQP